MPVTPFQTEVLRLLAQNRSPDSYVAGATVLNFAPDSARFSKDIDLFHDPAESVIRCAAIDIELLKKQGFLVETLLEQRGFVRAIVARSDNRLRLEWVSDTAFRFFPVISDPDLGYRLHHVDAAINKCLVLANRSEVRDVVDMVQIHKNVIHLGLCAWAACGKDPGFTPDLILELMSRNARITPDLLALEALREPIDPKKLKLSWLAALNEARDLIGQLDANDLGCLYLDSQMQVVQTVKKGVSYERHFGSVRGAWPTT